MYMIFIRIVKLVKSCFKIVIYLFVYDGRGKERVFVMYLFYKIVIFIYVVFKGFL